MQRMVYFIHPPATYNTRTERSVTELIKNRIGDDIKVISPSKLSRGRIRRWKEEVAMCSAVVGMALEGNYTVSVWTVLEYAQEKRLPVYTVEVDEGGHRWKDGILEDIEKLSAEESRKFVRRVTLGSTKDMLLGMFIGGRRKY
jgi:hypothetical protein